MPYQDEQQETVWQNIYDDQVVREFYACSSFGAVDSYKKVSVCMQKWRELWIVDYTGTQSFRNTLSHSLRFLYINLNWVIQTKLFYQRFYFI